jgi:hypothetical protein
MNQALLQLAAWGSKIAALNKLVDTGTWKMNGWLGTARSKDLFPKGLYFFSVQS